MEFIDPVQEYNVINESLKENTDDLYTELIKKEDNVLKAINKVTEHTKASHEREYMIYNMSIAKFIAMFANTWKNIYLEIIIQRRFKETISILLQKDRRVYIGVMMILISIFLFFIEISS